MEKKKTLQELTLMDRFLFDEAMEQPENMEAMLQIILGEEKTLKHPPQSEKEQRMSARVRSARLDLWVEDTDDNVYDTEVQRKNKGNLPKRSRYYQAMIDSKLLEPGVKDFNLLNPVYIIFISPFDLFGESRYRYTFSMHCDEATGIKLEDQATRIFLNTHGTDDEHISSELKELLYFMEHTNESSMDFQSQLVQRIQRNVQNIQNNEEVGMKYIHELEERTESREEGKTNALLQSIKNLMETTGWTAEQAMQKLKISEDDRKTILPLL